MPTQSFAAYMDSLDACLSAYIPPPSTWTPVEDALFKPRDLFRIPPAEAEALQCRAIRHAFTHHYTHNRMYRAFCQEHGVSPDDIKTVEHLEKIPLIPDRFFKEYPAGRDLARWIANIYTGDLPRVVVKGQDPSFDDVVGAFNAAGLVVAFSSGTGGRHTVIPRDRRTFLTSEYAAAKTVITMIYPDWDPDMFGYLLMPNPRKTNVFAGKVCTVYFDAIHDVQVAIDRDVSADVVRAAMTGQKNLRTALVRLAMQLATRRMIDRIIHWLERHDRAGHKMTLVGAPFLIMSLMKRLQQQGRHLELAERAGIATGGGWKIYEDQRMPSADFRRMAADVLGIADRHCLDVYGMVEGNGWMVHCPEGHYLHIPTSYYRPLVLDDDFKPLGYGQWGHYAFLDSAATSYPGFVLTGDVVRLLERCPVCDRLGPVLEPEIRRATGEEMRGCAEEVRRMVATDLGG